MSDDSLRWEEPPADAFEPQRVRAYWWKRISPLVERPGEWARIAGGYASRSYVKRVVRELENREFNYPSGRFEFVQSDDSIYGRYLGPGEG